MRRLAFLAVLLLLAGGGAFLMARLGEIYSCRLCDFDTYAATGERILAGEPVYAGWQFEPYVLIDAARGNGFVYPPSSAVLLTWAAWTPAILWRLTNLMALIVVSALMVKHRGLTTTVAAITVLMLFSPMWNAWANGQVTPLLAAGFGLAWIYPKWAWAVAALGGAIKLFPFILLAWVLRERGWREVGYGIALAVGIALLTLPVTGAGAWGDFIQVLRNGEPNCTYAPINSVRCVLGPSIGPEAAQLLSFVTAAAMTALAVVVGSRALAFVLLSSAVIVAAPDLNRPYWLFLFIGGLAVVSGIDWGTAWRRRITRSDAGRPADGRARSRPSSP